MNEFEEELLTRLGAISRELEVANRLTVLRLEAEHPDLAELHAIEDCDGIEEISQIDAALRQASWSDNELLGA